MTCPQCGGPVTRRGRRGPRAVFCSRLCAQRSWHARQPEPAPRRLACVECGSSFDFASMGRPPRYCGTWCRRRAEVRRQSLRVKAALSPSQRARARARNLHRHALKRSRLSDLTAADVQAMKEAARRCPLCGVTMSGRQYEPSSKHLDHIIPISQGGAHTRANVRVICQTCNLSRPKDGRDLRDFQPTLWSVAV